MPEKSLTEIARPLRERYEKGTVALTRKNWDYAIAIFNEILQKEPAFYEGRAALREAQLKKAGQGTSFFKKVFGTASHSPLLAKGQILLRTNPLEAINVAEQMLNSDPNNIAAHKMLAEAALDSDFLKTAVLSLEIAMKNSPKDKEIGLRLGEALARAGQPARAEAIYSELRRAYPNDGAIAQALKNVTASRTMSEGGYQNISGGEGSYRDILKDKAEAVSLEQEHRQVKTDDLAAQLIQEYEARLPQEPQNLKLRRNIAELYVQKKDFDRALEYYRQILADEGASDPSLEKAVTDTTLKKLEHSLVQLDPAAPGYAETFARIQAERDAFELSECLRRAERYPNDLQIRFDLGKLYFRAGKITEAIQEFQRAQNNPNRRVAALSYLGQCFARRGMNDLAARTLQNAIKEKVVFDEEKKELIYSLGCVLEKMGKTEEAFEQLKQIYEVDIGYKDIAARVDAYYASK
jgi:tetratricopeptide (TPR) repeat protein